MDKQLTDILLVPSSYSVFYSVFYSVISLEEMAEQDFQVILDKVLARLVTWLALCLVLII